MKAILDAGAMLAVLAAAVFEDDAGKGIMPVVRYSAGANNLLYSFALRLTRRERPSRKGGRVVECAGLEIQYTFRRIEGSNPSLSASIQTASPLQETGPPAAALFSSAPGFLVLPLAADRPSAPSRACLNGTD
jgi:hypothetical protein